MILFYQSIKQIRIDILDSTPDNLDEKRFSF
jgi:hypothetical protein